MARLMWFSPNFQGPIAIWFSLAAYQRALIEALDKKSSKPRCGKCQENTLHAPFPSMRMSPSRGL
jgi:hypothetical protein